MRISEFWKKVKPGTAVFLAVVMILSAVQLPAFADESEVVAKVAEENTVEESVAEGNAAEEPAVEEAVAEEDAAEENAAEENATEENAAEENAAEPYAENGGWLRYRRWRSCLRMMEQRSPVKSHGRIKL